jgi:hypothetical protein
MRNLKTFVWVILYLGVFVCSIALFTPAAFFENIIWNHKIINWIWGLFQDTFNSAVTSSFYEDPIQLVPSVITSSIVLISILFLGIELLRHRDNLKKGLINLFIYVIPAACIIFSTIFWMVMMEIAERSIYDISMWSRYVPGFGVLGLFIGASLIIFRSVLTKLIKLR